MQERDMRNTVGSDALRRYLKHDGHNAKERRPSEKVF
jgi:hypothetical protein